MNATTTQSNLTVSPGEKIVPVMVYTDTSVVWGELVVRDIVRVSTWLRTNTAPDAFAIYNARVMGLSAAQPKAVTFTEMHVMAPYINAYHILPPVFDPVDYDPTEPNRKMEPVTAVVGAFRMDGHMRMATSADLRHYLEFTRETFTPLYDVEIRNMLQPALAPMKVAFVLLRQSTTMFATRVK